MGCSLSLHPSLYVLCAATSVPDAPTILLK
jgi:hypothetical protein